ncbi:MAG: hypothetical protein M5U34_39120 [Chloroflexi bacterium]|nr:hypothetical protein [Chloroflexota bacterium]
METAVPTPLPTALPPIPTAPAPATPTRLPTTTPAPLPTLPSPLIVNPVDADMEQTAVAQGVALHVVDSTNSGVWQYPQDTFIQPVSLATWQTDAFLLDAGRLLRLHLAEPQAAEVLLQAGDVVEGVTVIEPLALHPAPDGLLVLDRAGDVYRYEWATAAWRLDRYDRPISDTSSHYYTALSGVGNGRYLLETSYKYVLLYEDGVQQSLWNLPELRGVDVAAAGESVYVLGQSMDDTSAVLLRYENTSTVAAFQPDVALDQARDVVAGETAVYVLDQNGKRLLAFSPESGKLQALYQLPAQDAISAIALLPGSETLLLAGRNRLFFLEQPERSANLPGVPLSQTRNRTILAAGSYYRLCPAHRLGPDLPRFANARRAPPLSPRRP